MPKTIKLSGVVGWEITAKGLENRLVKDDKNTVYVDSVGGSVFEGNRLYNLLLDKVEDGYDIDIVLGAVAASMASVFPMAVGAENIKVRANTVLMGHRPWSFTIGDADAMRTEAEILEGFDIMIAKAYSKVNGKTVAENQESMKNEFWLMGGQAVIDAGFASGIVENDDEDTEENEDGKEKSEIQAMIQEAKAVLKEKGQEEDLEQWAAKLKEPVVNEQGQIEMFEPKNNGKAPQLADLNNKLEADMNFKEYLDQNLEAKAEHEELIKTAKAEAVKEDRERTSNIVRLYGQSESAVNAIKDGTSVGDLAVAEKENAIKVAEAAGKETPDVGGLDKSKNGMPEKVDSKKSAEKKDEDAVKAYLDSQNKGVK